MFLKVTKSLWASFSTSTMPQGYFRTRIFRPPFPLAISTTAFEPTTAKGTRSFEPRTKSQFVIHLILFTTATNIEGGLYQLLITIYEHHRHKQNSIKIVNNPPSLYNKIVLNRHSPMIFQGHKYYLCPIILGNGILGRFPPKSSERLSSVKIFCLPRKIFIHRDKICA